MLPLACYNDEQFYQETLPEATRPLERLVAQHLNSSVVGSAASYLCSACKSGTSRKYNVSPELLLLLMSESCIVCVSVLRPNMASVLSSQA